MRLSPGTIRGWIAALALSLGAYAWAQEPASPLGDVARKTRKEHSSAAHVPAKQVTNEEEDGPDAGGVWRVRTCPRTPCYELSITLPKSPKWSRPEAEPRPVLIPLVGHEDEPGRAVRIYAAEGIGPQFPALDIAKRAFLQGLFARPEYFGQAAHLVLDVHVSIDGYQALITQFTVNSNKVKYQGIGVISSAPNGNYGFACVFRDEDTSAAASICEAIVKSAKSQILEPAKPQMYPSYPTQYYPQYTEPPENDDHD